MTVAARSAGRGPTPSDLWVAVQSLRHYCGDLRALIKYGQRLVSSTYAVLVIVFIRVVIYILVIIYHN